LPFKYLYAKECKVTTSTLDGKDFFAAFTIELLKAKYKNFKLLFAFAISISVVVLPVPANALTFKICSFKLH